ncbi:hypothetical protein JHW43_005404, partial [Diplocarpon mali]
VSDPAPELATLPTNSNADRKSYNHVLHSALSSFLALTKGHSKLTWSAAAMAVLFVATFPPHVLHKVACHRFAFVEYESRRDADDAYHEMHNKRLGRDDMLKIEACCYFNFSSLQSLIMSSGPELPLLPHGALIPAASASVLAVLQAVAAVLLAVEVVLHLLDVAVATTLLVRTIAETETTTAVTVTATALAVQRTGIAM